MKTDSTLRYQTVLSSSDGISLEKALGVRKKGGSIKWLRLRFPLTGRDFHFDFDLGDYKESALLLSFTEENFSQFISLCELLKRERDKTYLVERHPLMQMAQVFRQGIHYTYQNLQDALEKTLEAEQALAGMKKDAEKYNAFIGDTADQAAEQITVLLNEFAAVKEGKA